MYYTLNFTERKGSHRVHQTMIFSLKKKVNTYRTLTLFNCVTHCPCSRQMRLEVSSSATVPKQNMSLSPLFLHRLLSFWVCFLSWVLTPESPLLTPESSSRNFPRLWVFSKNFIELRPTKFTDFSTLAWNWNLLPHFTSVTRVRATNPASSGRMSDKQSQRIGKQAIYCMPIFVYFWGIFSIFWTLSSFAFSSTPLPPKFPVW